MKTGFAIIPQFIPVIFFLFISISFISAQNGTLNINFGDSGKVVNQICMGESKARALLLHPNGSVFVGGETYGSFFNFSGIVAKHQPNGFLDSTFGNNGTVPLSLFVDWNIYDMARQGNKIIGVGIIGMYNFAAFRFLQNGTLDSSFATDGVFSLGTLPQFGDGFAGSVALQPDGKIVICGEIYLDSVAVVCRLKSNGDLDSTFNSNGFKKLEFATLNTRANSLLLQPDGKVVIGGMVEIANKNEMILFRLNGNGSFDYTFGKKGIVVLQNGIAKYIRKVLLQDDGKIIAVCNDGKAIKTMRFLSDGTLDSSYAVNAISTIGVFGYNNTIANDADLLPDQSVIIVGFVDSTFKSQMITRVFSDGKLDVTFGTNGFILSKDTINTGLFAVKVRGNSEFFVAGTELGNCYLEPVLKSYYYQNGIGIIETSKANHSIDFYPNPSSGVINITLLNKTTLQLLNQQGQVVWQKVVKAGKTTLRIENVKSGLYFMMDEKGNFEKIVIVNEW